MFNLYKIIGSLGIILIVIGILLKKKKQNVFYIFGGVLLEIYSIYIKDIIFIALELSFILAALYDFLKISFKPSLHI